MCAVVNLQQADAELRRTTGLICECVCFNICVATNPQKTTKCSSGLYADTLSWSDTAASYIVLLLCYADISRAVV